MQIWSHQPEITEQMYNFSGSLETQLQKNNFIAQLIFEIKLTIWPNFGHAPAWPYLIEMIR